MHFLYPLPTHALLIHMYFQQTRTSNIHFTQTLLLYLLLLLSLCPLTQVLVATLLVLTLHHSELFLLTRYPLNDYMDVLSSISTLLLLMSLPQAHLSLPLLLLSLVLVHVSLTRLSKMRLILMSISD